MDGVPSGESISVTSEQHNLLGEFNEFVNNLGANPLTMRIFNTTGTIEYRGPFDSSGVSDYTIVPGTSSTALAVRRTPNSAITSGDTVLMDYDHVENFTVEYQTNFVIPTVQTALDAQKHVTADLLGKAAVEVPVDITATIVTTSGATVSTVDTDLRTNIATFLRALPQGSAVRRSDIIAVMDNTRNVSFIEVPLRKFARGAGSLVVREPVSSEVGETQILLGSVGIPYSDSTVKTWILENPLNNPTVQGGGDGTQFRGVFQDDLGLILQLTNPENLKEEPGRAFITGNEGLSIPNFSDDATIQQQFPEANTAQEIEALRQQISGNRVLVSLAANDRPSLHSYTATYSVAFVENRIQDIEASFLEFFDAGSLILTFTEDQHGV